jgi:hypothetical protein
MFETASACWLARPFTQHFGVTRFTLAPTRHELRLGFDVEIGELARGPALRVRTAFFKEVTPSGTDVYRET